VVAWKVIVLTWSNVGMGAGPPPGFTSMFRNEHAFAAGLQASAARSTAPNACAAVGPGSPSR
jgi:hypothetical protein